jgi:small neutral amino acid transporter SnatA (MarC family)
MNSSVAIAGISILFLTLSFGTVTGLYRLNVFGLSLDSELRTDAGLVLMLLGLCGVLYLLAKIRRNHQQHAPAKPVRGRSW